MHAAAFLKVHGQKSAVTKTAVDTVCAMALQAVDEARVDEIGVFEPSHALDLVSLQILNSWGGSIHWTGLLD